MVFGFGMMRWVSKGHILRPLYSYRVDPSIVLIKKFSTRGLLLSASNKDGPTEPKTGPPESGKSLKDECDLEGPRPRICYELKEIFGRIDNKLDKLTDTTNELRIGMSDVKSELTALKSDIKSEFTTVKSDIKFSTFTINWIVLKMIMNAVGSATGFGIVLLIPDSV